MFQFRCIARDAAVLKNHETFEAALNQFNGALKDLSWEYCQVNEQSNHNPILSAVKEDKKWVVRQM